MIAKVVAKAMRLLCTNSVIYNYAKTSKAQSNQPTNHNRPTHTPFEQKNSKNFKSESLKL